MKAAMRDEQGTCRAPSLSTIRMLPDVAACKQRRWMSASNWTTPAIVGLVDKLIKLRASFCRSPPSRKGGRSDLAAQESASPRSRRGACKPGRHLPLIA